MAGEMTQSEVTRESYPLHFAIADAFNGTVKAFDQYQGPYVSIGGDVRVGSGPYAMAPRLPGVVRLWIQAAKGSDGCFVTVYNEDNEKLSKPFPWNDKDAAVDMAASVLPKPKAILTTHSAKQIIKRELDRRGLAYSKLTARTVSFSDLARGDCIFVKIAGWHPNPAWDELKAVAKANKFCIEA